MNQTIAQTIERLLDRPDESNKYTFGHTLVIGGSPGMVGAPLLAALAALRTGSGLATIASTPEVIDKLEQRIEDVMTFRISADNPAGSLAECIKKRHVTTLVIGPGTTADSAELLRTIACDIQMPTVLDAGGIIAFQDHLLLLEQRELPPILTPHSGEFERLTSSTLPVDMHERERSVAAFAQACHVHIILKGAHSFIAHPDGSCAHNDTGNPGLAVAGTGDILSGIIAGILAQGFTPNEAVETGAYIHGLAGDIAAGELTEPGMIASDLLHYIPRALKQAGGQLRS